MTLRKHFSVITGGLGKKVEILKIDDSTLLKQYAGSLKNTTIQYHDHTKDECTTIYGLYEEDIIKVFIVVKQNKVVYCGGYRGNVMPKYQKHIDEWLKENNYSYIKEGDQII